MEHLCPNISPTHLIQITAPPPTVTPNVTQWLSCPWRCQETLPSSLLPKLQPGGLAGFVIKGTKGLCQKTPWNIHYVIFIIYVYTLFTRPLKEHWEILLTFLIEVTNNNFFYKDLSLSNIIEHIQFSRNNFQVSHSYQNTFFHYGYWSQKVCKKLISPFH